MNGIISFHDGINFGAFLQVYALQNFLNNKGIQNEIINYKNKLHFFNEYKCLIYTRNPKLLYLNFKKVIKFKEAQNKLRRTSFLTKVEKYKKKYDNIFFGSDEIWNFKNTFVGTDLVYFGKGLSADKFISYATSFGAVNYGDTIPDVLQELLSSFHAISVRDVNSLRILRDFYCGAIEIVLDPIFLYDYRMDIDNTGHEKNYILVYTVGLDPDVQNKLKEYAADKGKKLISVGYLNNFCDSNVIDIGPFEFLNYVINADEIVTSMFHGVLFALKYKKQFCIVVDPYRVNKFSAVVKTFKIEDRIFINDFHAVFNTQVKHDFIHNVIEKEKIKSEGFIINSIKK
jgi:hypothetical protein